MYLSRLLLDRRSWAVRRDLANVYEMHRTVMRAFPNAEPGSERVLFRVDERPDSGVPVLLVQSRTEPDWSFLASEKYLFPDDGFAGSSLAVKSFAPALCSGQVLSFRLLAAPAVKKARDGARQGRRVSLSRPEEQMNWLEMKLGAAGVRLLHADISRDGRVDGRKSLDGQSLKIRFLGVQYDGLLQVDDPDRLTRTLQAGIGSGKSMGFGLLSLAPAV